MIVRLLGAGPQEVSSSYWRSWISEKLVPEVQKEIMRFYGGTDDEEARYPGLDYSNPNHRLRLESWNHHRELFEAFDSLHLTKNEIYRLCRWHGTKRSKDEYERNNNKQVIDTTWEDIATFAPQEPTLTLRGGDVSDIERSCGKEFAMMNEADDLMQEYSSDNDDDMADHSDASDEESEDEMQQSIGLELNQRLMANAEANAQARARGEPVTMDADWEQWLKEASERDAAGGGEGSSSVNSIDLAHIRQERDQSLSTRLLARARQPGNVSQTGPVSSATINALLNSDSMEVSGTSLSSTVQGH